MASSDWSHVVTGSRRHRRRPTGCVGGRGHRAVCDRPQTRRPHDPQSSPAPTAGRVAPAAPARRRPPCHAAFASADAVDRIPDVPDRPGTPTSSPSWDTPTTRSWWPLPCARSSTRPARTPWRTTGQAARKGCDHQAARRHPRLNPRV